VYRGPLVKTTEFCRLGKAISMALIDWLFFILCVVILVLPLFPIAPIERYFGSSEEQDDLD
jgi:uncharacterized RDD family membrane protein YckC